MRNYWKYIIHAREFILKFDSSYIITFNKTIFKYIISVNLKISFYLWVKYSKLLILDHSKRISIILEFPLGKN